MNVVGIITKIVSNYKVKNFLLSNGFGSLMYLVRVCFTGSPMYVRLAIGGFQVAIDEVPK